MKFIIIFILWINIMAQEKVPYPYPNYNDDLLAKEIINGTYYASIQMMIKNSQTGDERYVFVPDSPEVIDDAIHSKGHKPKRIESYDQNMSVYDRDKMLEDAVLPKYVDVDEKEPIIVSKAMTPTDISYVGELNIRYRHITRFKNNNTSFFVGVQKTSDGTSSLNLDGDVYTFFRHDGTARTKMFDVGDGTEPMSIDWIYSIGNRNFFSSFNKLYEYNESGFYHLPNASTRGALNIIVRDGNNYYTILTVPSQIAKNIDSGGEILSSGAYYITSGVEHRVSAYKENYFFSSAYTYFVKDGVFGKYEKISGLYRNTHKVRFDYHRDRFPTDYNLRKGVHDAPKTYRPTGETKIIGLKEGYVAIGLDDFIYFTKNYKDFIKTGIKSKRGASIVITKDFIYFYYSNSLVVVSPDGWAYEPPDGRYYELFARNGMTNNRGIYIGD